MLGFGENDPEISEGAADKMSQFPRTKEVVLLEPICFIFSPEENSLGVLCRPLRVSKIPVP